MFLQIDPAVRQKSNAFLFELRALQPFTAEHVRRRKLAKAVHNAVAGQVTAIRALPQRPTDLPCRPRAPRKRGNPAVGGNMPRGNMCDKLIDAFIKIIHDMYHFLYYLKSITVYPIIVLQNMANLWFFLEFLTRY
jgi:hypothetical protein